MSKQTTSLKYVEIDGQWSDQVIYGVPVHRKGREPLYNPVKLNVTNNLDTFVSDFYVSTNFLNGYGEARIYNICGNSKTGKTAIALCLAEGLIKYNRSLDDDKKGLVECITYKESKDDLLQMCDSLDIHDLEFVNVGDYPRKYAEVDALVYDYNLPLPSHASPQININIIAHLLAEKCKYLIFTTNKNTDGIYAKDITISTYS